MASITMQRGVRGRRPNLFAALSNAFGVWRQRRHLQELDAYLLRDVGLSESEVRSEIDRSVWDVPQNWRF
jgi:uncharacterized protein YjiS (DUF1127 family)